MEKVETREKSCEDRIDEELKSRVEDIERVLEAVDSSEDGFEIDGDKYEDLAEWINWYALAYNDDPHYRAKRLELSYGGPQDYFLFFEDGTIEYHFLDWFDGAKRILHGRDEEVLRDLHERCFGF